MTQWKVLSSRYALILVRKEAPEPLRRQLGVPGGVLDVAVAQPLLQGAGVHAVVGELEAAGVPEHVRVDGEGEVGRLADPGDELLERGRRERPLALADEHVGGPGRRLHQPRRARREDE